ncbi:MAG: J domain-containing protein [Bacteroidetes bacterium]|nr:J domain-containing protein [Bacteroidota bacterium]
MADHYSILGVSKQATAVEIKAAFRRLAKLYHPDKNPGNPQAKELFAAILRAYEILSDPVQKKRYDLYYASGKDDVQTTPQQRRAKKQKEWSFTEEDLKKRQYYQQYYKQQKEKSVNTQTVSKPYSDYKYILFATPIAVCLLMLIISLFAPRPEAETNVRKTPPVEPVSTAPAPQTGPQTGEQVYSGFFGAIRTAQTPYALRVTNTTGSDAVVAVFDSKTNKYLQHAYIHNGYFAEFSMLPKTGVYVRSIIGRHWNPALEAYHHKVSGCFDTIQQIQDLRNDPVTFHQKTGLELINLSLLSDEREAHIAADSVFFRR